MCPSTPQHGHARHAERVPLARTRPPIPAAHPAPLLPPQKPRLPEDLVIHYESYDQSDTVDKLKQHDDELAAHYNSLNRNLNSAAWTGIVADKFSEPRRTFLREVLTDLGMSFE